MIHISIHVGKCVLHISKQVICVAVSLCDLVSQYLCSLTKDIFHTVSFQLGGKVLPSHAMLYTHMHRR